MTVKHFLSPQLSAISSKLKFNLNILITAMFNVKDYTIYIVCIMIVFVVVISVCNFPCHSCHFLFLLSFS